MSGKEYSTLPKDDVDENLDNAPNHTEASKDKRQDRQSSRTRSISGPTRPHVYYGEGPFDAPSSDSEEEQLLEKGENDGAARSPGTAERGLAFGSAVADGEGEGLVVGGKKRPASIRFLLISLCAVLAIAALIGVLSARSYTGTAFSLSRGSKRITMDHIFNGTFSVNRASIRWVPELGDGVFAIIEDYQIKIKDLKTNTTTELVSLANIKNERGSQLYIYEWQLSADAKYLLVKTDYKKQWRWSSFGNYYIYNIETQTTHPLVPPSNPPTISHAVWSPTENAIAYVQSNDLYIQPTPDPDVDPIRVTETGNPTFFNGVADWVYEEEVFSSPSTLWWSPDSSRLVFLTLDETQVPIYSFPIYNPSDSANNVYPYTETVEMKYPKPGYPNPIVSVRLFNFDKYWRGSGFTVEESMIDLTWSDRLDSDNSIIFEVQWVANSSLIVKEANRAADTGSVILFEFDDASGTDDNVGRVVRKLGKEGEQSDDGWINTSRQTIYTLPTLLLGNGESAYLDIVNDTNGFDHIALFYPADSSEPVFLTRGSWEVTGKVSSFDVEKQLVYFQAAMPSSTERNILSVALPPINSSLADIKTFAEELTVTPLTDTEQPNYYSASFSPQAGFYMLNYDGPRVPWQAVLKTEDDDFFYSVTTNSKLNSTLGEFQAPTETRFTIMSDGYELNVKEIRPPNMDDTGRTKYPVLFHPYGGPASQSVSVEFSRDWHYYLAGTLKYIVVVVDGRGTGFKGRALRNPVKGQLGRWETVDQINAARIWASKKYVDPKKIGIWGSSYGGFLASKVVEADAGVHSLAMAVAPVTSWMLYDSIYTERYMGLPEANPDGYRTASVANVTGFNNVNYLLMHGSGDDNVHFQNSAHLIDMLTQAGVRGFEFRMYTDSAHTVARRGAYREHYEFMTSYMIEKWGRGGRRKGW